MQRLRMPAAAATIIFLGLLAAGVPLGAGDAKPKPAGTVFEALTHAINVGAELYNVQGDVAGCYRIFQGALLTVRPNLAPHPQLLAEVDEALKKAEEQPRLVDRAFTLREVLGNVREKFRPAQAEAPKKIDSKKDEPTKKDEPKKAIPKKDDKNKDDAKVPGANEGKLFGTVRLDAQPGPTGYLTLVGGDTRVYSTFIHDDGTYVFRTFLPIGAYRIGIETAHKEKAPPPKGQYPPRYKDPATSGLTVDVKKGPQNLDLKLSK